jgi:hypothetical protein
MSRLVEFALQKRALVVLLYAIFLVVGFGAFQ